MIRSRPAVAEIVAAELGYSEQWQSEQVGAFTKLASACTLVLTSLVRRSFPVGQLECLCEKCRLDPDL